MTWTYYGVILNHTDGNTMIRCRANLTVACFFLDQPDALSLVVIYMRCNKQGFFHVAIFRKMMPLSRENIFSFIFDNYIDYFFFQGGLE